MKTTVVTSNVLEMKNQIVLPFQDRQPESSLLFDGNFVAHRILKGDISLRPLSVVCMLSY